VNATPARSSSVIAGVTPPSMSRASADPGDPAAA